MRKLRNLLIVLSFSSLSILLTSSVPVTKTPPPDKQAVVLSKLDKLSADGKLTNKELIQIATEWKGEKLTLKEKIGLKLFGKKIVNKTSASAAANGSKSQLTAFLLCFFLGVFGIHRFYLGYTWQGLVQLFTLGGLGIWALIDLIRIITGDLQPKNGPYDKTFND